MLAEIGSKGVAHRDQGLIHFIAFNTEENFTAASPQLRWLADDLAAVDRAKTPWVVFAGHRPYLVSSICSGWSGASGPNARAATLGKALEEALEPVFERHQVNLALWGHVHDYERTCPVRRRKCIAPGAAGADGGTTHAIIGNAGHGVHSTLNSSGFITGCGMWVLPEPDWIAFRAFEHGYARLTAHNASSLHFQAVMNRDRAVHDDFWLHRTPGLKSDEAQYELYRPKIERSFVLDTHSSPLQYNHDATIAFFADTWFALWNAGRKCKPLPLRLPLSLEDAAAQRKKECRLSLTP